MEKWKRVSGTYEELLSRLIAIRPPVVKNKITGVEYGVNYYVGRYFKTVHFCNGGYVGVFTKVYGNDTLFSFVTENGISSDQFNCKDIIFVQ